MNNIFLKKINIIFLLILCFFIYGNTQVSAQEFSVYSANDIFLETSPEIPGPNENVSLTLNSYSFNLNNYFITWFKNGQKTLTGYGEKNLQFTTAATGVPTDITAVIEIDDQVYRKEYRFTPSTIDLIWEAADAYAPPFYKGKKIPMKESLVRITAIPETQLIAPADAPKLIYYWDNNYVRDIDGSGFGKQYYEFYANPINDEEFISVTSNDRRENSFANNSVKIPTGKFLPETLFYEINNNNRVMTNRALNNFNNTDKSQIKLSFHPLHFSTTQTNFTDIFVNWKINNNSQAPQDFSRQNELFVAPQESSGSALIGVELEGIKNILQKHEESFRLSFL